MQQFSPGFTGLFVNPFYFVRKGLAMHMDELGSYITGKTLDIGCGSKPYQEIFHSTEYIGLELDTPENREKKMADFFYGGSRFPFDHETFDSAITSEVFEHVFNPDDFLREIQRVLKPNGILLMTVPFVWDEHEQPADFARYTSFGVRGLIEKMGFEVLIQRKTMDDIRVIFQLINAYIYKITVTKSPFLNLLSTVTLMAPFNILGEMIRLITPRNPDLYLDNIILARKPATQQS